MTIEDIENYIIRHNLNIPSNKPYVVYQRMFLYAYLYHIHKCTLRSIADMFNKKDHVTVRNGLIKAEYAQHYDEFIDATTTLMECTKFIIPPYKYRDRPKKKIQKPLDKYNINVKLTKAQFINYIKSKDEDIIYDILWEQFIKSSRYAKN